MPHCIIEYSAPLEASVQPTTLIDCCSLAAESSGVFEPTNLKLRAIGYNHYSINSGHQHFVHISFRLLSGRTSEQKQQLSSALIEGLEALKLPSTVITVEVIDMERDSYGKH